MADRPISELTQATQINDADLFVLQQSDTAKSVSGETLKNELAEMLDGHGGIYSVVKQSTHPTPLTDVYRITFADGTYTDFNVVNGNGITDISKTGTSGLVDTYTITYGNEDTATFTVTNGEKGDTGDAEKCYIRWSSRMPQSDTDVKNVPDAYMGVYVGTDATAPTDYSVYKWYQIKGGTGNTGNGISSVALDSTSGLTDTYRITFTSGNSTTFSVVNGSSIDSIEKVGTFGLTDNYEVSYTDGSTATAFDVTNGRGITEVNLVDGDHTPGTTDTYEIVYNDETSDSFTVYNGANGSGAVSSVNGIQPTGDDVILFLYGTAAPTGSTVGTQNQWYVDTANRKMYLCRGQVGSSYTWIEVGSGVTVDAAMSTSSTNPVQNKVIANALMLKLGAGDVIDNLTSVTTNRPLSANMGKRLNDTKADKAIVFTNLPISQADWVSDSTYTSYPYRATVTDNGVTSNMSVYVTYSQTDAESGEFAPVAATDTKKIYLYSNVQKAIIVPSIVCGGV